MNTWIMYLSKIRSRIIWNDSYSKVVGSLVIIRWYSMQVQIHRFLVSNCFSKSRIKSSSKQKLTVHQWWFPKWYILLSISLVITGGTKKCKVLISDAKLQIYAWMFRSFGGSLPSPYISWILSVCERKPWQKKTIVNN